MSDEQIPTNTPIIKIYQLQVNLQLLSWQTPGEENLNAGVWFLLPIEQVNSKFD